jgi:hypothetical protein
MVSLCNTATHCVAPGWPIMILLVSASWVLESQVWATMPGSVTKGFTSYVVNCTRHGDYCYIKQLIVFQIYSCVFLCQCSFFLIPICSYMESFFFSLKNSLRSAGNIVPFLFFWKWLHFTFLLRIFPLVV